MNWKIRTATLRRFDSVKLLIKLEQKNLLYLLILLSLNYPQKVKYMIIRLIIFIIIFALLWYLFRSIREIINQRANQVHKKQQTDDNEEKMVACELCGVYTPRSHAIKTKNNAFYCSKEHVKQGKQHDK